MSRRMRSLLALVVVGFVFGVAACSNATGPQPSSARADQACDWASNGTCHN
jgi:hypothetical protein